MDAQKMLWLQMDTAGVTVDTILIEKNGLTH